jgi:transcriptional regulator with XRE-family HTH domain
MRAIVAIDRIVAKKPQKQDFPANPQTLGEHIKRERMKRGLLQKDVAQILCVNVMTLTNWENNYRNVQVNHIPSIVEFLGYTPEILNDFAPLKSEVFLYRCKHGLTQKQMAKYLGIDSATLHAIEWGKRSQHISILEKKYTKLLFIEGSKMSKQLNFY